MKSIAIVGVGLIGGSVALALRRAMPVVRLIGVDRDAGSLDEALRRGLIDEAGDIASAGQCDLCLIAVPVGQLPEVLTSLAAGLKPNTVITDAGSTKQDVIAAARTALGAAVKQFVPGHPIAGRERAGVSAAASELFEGKHVVLTPLAENTADTIEQVRALWTACGARVVELPAAAHDAIFAAVSHLPHMLAFALVDDFAARPNAKTLFSFAASGFRDFTRIASSSPEMWRDIALNNRTALVAEFDQYLRHAQRLRDAIAAGNGNEIEALMQRARDAREQWLSGDLEPFRDDAA